MGSGRGDHCRRHVSFRRVQIFCFSQRYMHIRFKACYFRELASLEAGNFWFRATSLFSGRWKSILPGWNRFLRSDVEPALSFRRSQNDFPQRGCRGVNSWKRGWCMPGSARLGAEFSQMDARRFPMKARLMWSALLTCWSISGGRGRTAPNVQGTKKRRHGIHHRSTASLALERGQRVCLPRSAI